MSGLVRTKLQKMYKWTKVDFKSEDPPNNTHWRITCPRSQACRTLSGSFICLRVVPHERDIGNICAGNRLSSVTPSMRKWDKPGSAAPLSWYRPAPLSIRLASPCASAFHSFASLLFFLSSNTLWFFLIKKSLMKFQCGNLEKAVIICIKVSSVFFRRYFIAFCKKIFS